MPPKKTAKQAKTPTAKGKPKKVGGPKDRRTDKVTTQALLKALRVGAPITDACAVARISAGSFFRWMKEGEEALPGTLAREFFDKVEEAKAEPIVANLERMEKLSREGSFEATRWFLERRRRKEFGPIVRQEVSGPEGGPVQTESVLDASINFVAERLHGEGDGEG